MAKNGLERDIIVTGATGFIGQHLVPKLLESGYRVFAVSRDKKKAAEFNWFNEVQFISLDIKEGIDNLKMDTAKSAIHLAWQGLPNYRSEFHFTENLPSHYRFVTELVKKGVKHVLVTGTCFEYGLQHGPLKSSSPCVPNTPYGFAKDALHKQLRFFQQTQDFTLQWARLFYMYGRGQSATSVISQLDHAIDNNSNTFNMSGGEQLRDYLTVEAVAEQIINLFEEEQDGVFNICSGKPTSIRRLVEEHIASRGAKIKLNLGHYPYPDYEPFAFWGDK